MKTLKFILLGNKEVRTADSMTSAMGAETIQNTGESKIHKSRSHFICVILLVALAGLNTFRANAQVTVIDSGTCGQGINNPTWVFTSDSTLTISGIGGITQGSGTAFYPVRQSIKTVVIGDSITSITYCVFASCSNLKFVTIGKSVTSIGGGAFVNCTKIDTIICKAVTPPSLTIYYSFSGVRANIPVIIPCGTLNAYQTSDWGSSFTNFIEDCTPPPPPPSGNSISGAVMRPDSSALPNGTVELYQILSFSVYSLIDVVPIDSNGNYVFTNVSAGSYIIRAVAPGWENAFPTYYGNTEFWNQAFLVAVNNGSVQNKDIIIIPLPSSNNGNSVIGGYVGQNNGQKSLSQKSTDKPAEDVNVYLQKAENSIWTSVAHTLTNAEGYFEFKNIPAGKYRVVLDVVGLEHIDNPQVLVINDGDNIQNIEYEITSDGIKNKSGEETGIVETNAIRPEIRVYPNPATNQLKIKNYELKEDEVIEIYDVVGRTLNNYQLSIVNSQLIIDISHLANGIYFLKIGNNTVRFVKE